MIKSHILRKDIAYLTKYLPVRRPSSPVTTSLTNDSQRSKPVKNFEKFIITPCQITDHFRHEDYPKPDGRFKELTANFFLHAKPKLQWTLADYNDIPDVKQQQLQLNDANYVAKVKYSPLPEILMLGYTNSGKSTLINSLLQGSYNDSKSNQIAFASSKAGFTKTMNSFNISNKFILMDCPGYGKFGEQQQGAMVLEYIAKRKQLRSALVIIDSTRGFHDEDVQIINHLVDNGIPFDIIFSKVDIVIEKTMKYQGIIAKQLNHMTKQQIIQSIAQANDKVLENFHTMITEVGLHALSIKPKLIFYNSMTNAKVLKKMGFEEIRTTIIERCDLQQSLKAMRSKR